MFSILLGLIFALLDDSQPLVTQELVDRINNDPRSSFKAALHPAFASMTIGEARKFLAPVRKRSLRGEGHGSPRPVGANENEFLTRDRRVFTGYYNQSTGSTSWTSTNKYTYQVYDYSLLCGSWSAAVTSAMSLAISIHHNRWVNLSIQFILDCDLLGDPCVERPPLNAYEQFWRRYIPQADRWDQPGNPMRPPYFTLNETMCNARNGCYPGWQNCPRNLVMTGSCEPNGTDVYCPVYFLYNWRAIKSHLWEVGPVTSSIMVRPELFVYKSGVYSSLPVSPNLESYSRNANNGAGEGHFANTENTGARLPEMTEVLGMLDVTIIGWGQIGANLSNHQAYQAQMYNRWWYVIPHLGWAFGEDCTQIFGSLGDRFGRDSSPSILDNVKCGQNGQNEGPSGIMRFNRRFDDSSIESQAVGAVPFNFRPLPKRAPKRTGHPGSQ